LRAPDTAPTQTYGITSAARRRIRVASEVPKINCPTFHSPARRFNSDAPAAQVVKRHQALRGTAEEVAQDQMAHADTVGGLCRGGSQQYRVVGEGIGVKGAAWLFVHEPSCSAVRTASRTWEKPIVARNSPNSIVQAPCGGRVATQYTRRVTRRTPRARRAARVPLLRLRHQLHAPVLRATLGGCVSSDKICFAVAVRDQPVRWNALVF